MILRMILTTLLTLLVLSSSAEAATINVAPGGNITTAYNSAAAGDTILLGCGTHAPWTTPNGTKAVTVKAATRNCVKMKQLVVGASNITFDGLDLDAGGTGVKPPDVNKAVFDVSAVRNMTFKNGRIGNVGGQKGAMLGGDETDSSKHNVVIENTLFHDVRILSSGDHLECAMSHTPGVTFRGNTFRNCGVFNISLGRGDWYGQGQYGNVTIENNDFGHTVDGGAGGGWHYYGLAWWLTTLDGARVVNNTFENPVSMDRAVSGNGVWANNIGGGWDCVPGVTYTGNVGKACSASDKAVSPASSTSTTPAPYSWVNPSIGDFHLKAGSVAIDAGKAQYAPLTDIEGKGRAGAAPDAGAYEYQGTTTPPAPVDPVCSNGKDDDGDGKIDFPADLGCSSTTDETEAPDPPLVYHPACEPTCDAQISTLTSERNSARAERDAAVAARDALKAKLDRIDGIVHE